MRQATIDDIGRRVYYQADMDSEREYGIIRSVSRIEGSVFVLYDGDVGGKLTPLSRLWLDGE